MLYQTSAPQRRYLLTFTVLLFVAAEITLGILLQINSGRTASALSFSSVILACLFHLLWMTPTRNDILTQSALCCTVVADYFLVWLNPQIKLPSMVFFLAAQLLYATRLWNRETRPRLRQWHIPTRLLLSALIVAVTLAVLQASTDALALVSMLYYVNLILNLLFSLLQFRTVPLAAIGFFLFLCCDTVIGLEMLHLYFPIPPDSFLYRLIRPGFNLAWAFYLPSQALLALSSLPTWRKKRTAST